MKTSKKSLLCLLALILIVLIICGTMLVTNKNRIKEYSTYCMDEVRNQLWEYIWNISNFYEWRNENNLYLYNGEVSYEWLNYHYYCRVSWKNNAEVFLTNLTPWNEADNEEESYDFKDDENLVKYYPEVNNWFKWNYILWDTLQTNYIEWTSTIYYDPYRWIVFKLWEEFKWWLIREVDTDEDWYPKQEIILLVKGEENEENRTWINGFREVYTLTAISKENLENFGVTPDFEDKIIWSNNKYYFIGEKVGENTTDYYSMITFFDVEEDNY